MLLLVTFLVMSAASCQPTASRTDEVSTIRIGMTAPLTGAAAESGIALRQGAELATEEINATGGITVNGQEHKLELFVEDNESKPEVGVSAAEKLITRNDVHYLIGDAILSSVTMAVMELAPKYEVPIVSCESVSEAIVEKVLVTPDKYRYYWKGNFGSSAYADAVFNTVEWLVDREQFIPRTKKVFFIVEDTDYGRSNAKAASELFAGIGWDTAAIEVVPMGHTEFYPSLNKLREADADVLISIFTPLSSGVALVKQFRELDIGALHIAIYYPSRPEFIEQVGDAAEGLLWSPLIFDPDHIESQRAFSDQVQARFNVKATIDHAYGYDAVYNAVDSVYRAGSLEAEHIVKSVADLDRQGILGRYVFDQRLHQAKAGSGFIPILTAQIQAGRNLVVWPADLATAEYESQSWVK